MTFSRRNLSRSKVFEWTIIRQLQIEFFWRDSPQNEVDAIKINKDGSISPIDIKYGKIQTKGMIKFLRNFDLNEGFILFKDNRQLIKYLLFSSSS